MAERWLTYQQAGEVLGMSPEAARQRARRLKWRTQPGNDGRTLVLLPEALDIRPRVRPPGRTAGQPPVQTPEQTGGQPPVQPPGQTGDDKALADVVAAFREVEARLLADLEAARARADLAEQEREEARIRAAHTEGEVDGLKTSAEHMHEELARMRREVAEAHNRAVVAEREAREATSRREGAEAALAKIRKWSFLNFLFGREGRSRQ
jgi:hypothetical protein